MATEILCTLGPASLNERVICRLEELGVSLFRINLSHVMVEDLPDIIGFVRSKTQVPICLDTEGAQIRTGLLPAGRVEVQDNALVRITKDPARGDTEDLNLYPRDIVDTLQVGDLISIDFNAALGQVVDLEANYALLRILNGGTIGSNKAVTVDRPIAMPPLTEKDRAALELSLTYNIDRVALSFANRGSDVDQIRTLASTNATVIAKIECQNALTNLDDIIDKADALLIDRGDLSREIPIEKIPSAQKMIIARAKHHGKKVYVATNLLESMVKDPAPTRAEVNDVFNTLLDGADGLVLAAETAIGSHPIGCANMIVKLVQEFEQRAQQTLQFSSKLGANATSLLVEPHGGELVNCRQPTPDQDTLSSLQCMKVKEKALIDCEQIAAGTFSPLRGFMDQATLRSVLNRYQLLDDTVWTMPILLAISEADAARTSIGDTVLLTDSGDTPRGTIENVNTYRMDLTELAQQWYGTGSSEHPGVAEIFEGSGWFLSGTVGLFDRASSLQRTYELTPTQARYIFDYKGWARIVAFHTRNVMHRAHEHIMLSALESSMADGLLLSPLAGPTKMGDFSSDAIVKSYQTILSSGLLPFRQAILGSLMTYPRYAGPREAVFTALCRKNMGCSHFIVGRDHAGVGGFYTNKMTSDLFDAVGEIGIQPIFFDEIGYNPTTDTYEPLSSNQGGLKVISGTVAREALRENKPLPDWYMRQIIQDQLRADIQAGKPIFND